MPQFKSVGASVGLLVGDVVGLPVVGDNVGLVVGGTVLFMEQMTVFVSK